MFLLFSLLAVSIILILVLNALSFFISETSILMREEISSYECGFEHHNVSRVPFSLRYFFLTLVFLLFDLEVILIIFTPSLVFSINSVIATLVITCFIVFLFISLLYEWNDGSLEWLA